MIAAHLDKVSVRHLSEPVFENLSWEIHEDRCVGLVGPNGSGKSTLLRLIAAELTSDTERHVRWGVHPANPRRYCRHRPHLAGFQLAKCGVHTEHDMPSSVSGQGDSTSWYST